MTRPFLLLVFVAAVTAIGLLVSASAPGASANPGAATMRFRVLSGGLDCNPAQEPASCSVLAGTSFQLGTAVDAFPAGGYLGYAVDIDWSGTGLVYKPTADPADENLLPGSLPARAIGSQRVQSGAVILDMTPSTNKGPVHRITMNCTSLVSSNVINLRPYDTANLLGAALLDSTGATVAVPPTSITINCVQKQAEPGDTDGDGCSDQRNFLYFWDFYDVWNYLAFGQPSYWTRDGVVNVPGDILGVARRFGTMRPGGPPTESQALGEALVAPVDFTSYHAAFDRGMRFGPHDWDLNPPDGAINIPNDVLGVAKQFGHSCGPIMTHSISGVVYESFSGVLRGATVTRQPSGEQTTTSLVDGSFSFPNVADGSYTLTVSPGCTPFGCYVPTKVNVAGSDVFVAIYPVPLPTPTPTPTPTP